MDEKKVLVVEDELAISDIIKFNLIKDGYQVETAFDGEEALKKINDYKPDLILLDIMIPKIDGFQVCKKVRETSDTPIIMLTAKEEELDKVLGLELGADDYITKPFSMRELFARINANIRRVNFSSGQIKNEDLLELGGILIDVAKYEVKKNNEILELTLREFELLKYLATQENQIFTREQLLEDVWGYEYYGDIRTVDVTVRRLREKIEDNASAPKYILTKRGIGYYFRRT